MWLFTGLWPLVSHLTEAGFAIAVLVAAGFFSPVFKKEFAYAAGVVAIAVFVYAWGVRDEKHRRDALDAAAQSDVDRAVRDADGKGKDRWNDPRN